MKIPDNNQINFSYNWNNKLSGNFFTTLRLKDENRFQEGMVKTICLNGKPLFRAEIMGVRHYMLHQINDYVAGLDTGYTADQCRDMIKKMYQKSNIDWSKRSMSLILFRRIKEEKTQKQATTNP